MGMYGVGAKNDCVSFDNVQISCESGICKNVSSVYSCNFESKLEDIKGTNKKKQGTTDGYCNCNKCEGVVSKKAYPGECPEQNKQCVQMYPDYPNDTIAKICSDVPCSDCWSICHKRGECFDMHSRRDPTVIGTDEYGLPDLRYYNCIKVSISNLIFFEFS